MKKSFLDSVFAEAERRERIMMSLPTPILNPKALLAPARLTGAKLACTICGEDITDQNQQIHYGAVACFSCRAFFRRAQGLKRPFQPCKKGENCVLTVDSRRFCGVCRYTACLRAGMNPKAVLSEDQKKHRFRKMIKRRKENLVKQQQQSPQHHTMQNSPPQMMSQLSPQFQYEQKAHASDESNSSMTMTTSNSCSPTSTPDLIVDEKMVITPPLPPPPQASPVLFNFDSFNNVSHLEKAFLDIHMDSREPSMAPMTLLLDLYSELGRQFRHFSSKLPRFNSLGFVERQIFLAENTPAFAHFILCLYLSSGPTGNEQLSVLFPHLRTEHMPPMKTVAFSDLYRGPLMMPLIREDSLLFATYADDFEALISLAGNKCYFNINKLFEEILFQQFGSEDRLVHNSPLNEFEVLMLQKLNELTHIGRSLWTLHLNKIPPQTKNVVQFWPMLHDLVSNVTRRNFRCYEDHLDDLEGLVKEKLPNVMSLYLVRLHFAKNLDEQLNVMDHADLNVKEDSAKVDVFRLNTIKPLLRRAVDQFESLIARFRRCFLNEEMFQLMVLLSLFWQSSNSNQTRREALSVHKERLLSVVRNLLKHTPTPTFGQTYFVEVAACLDELETLNELRDTFVCQEGLNM